MRAREVPFGRVGQGSLSFPRQAMAGFALVDRTDQVP
jgi:hypothetical protein